MKKIFLKNGIDERSLNYINNFINEFEEVFGKYLNREEVIKRIEENLNEFYFTEIEEVATQGRYYYEDKKIEISSDLEEKNIKEVVFHEMIHCITNNEGHIGFSYNILFDEYTDATGFNEGFTQLATKERNQKFNEKGIESYPILTEQVENFAKIIGKDNFYNIAFNCPEKIVELSKENGLIEDEVDIQFFFDAFNEVFKQEKEIYITRTKLGMLHRRIYKAKDDFRSTLTIAKNIIIEFYLKSYRKKKIVSVEDLNEMFEKINEYNSQLDNQYSHSVYDIINEKIDELKNNGIINEDNYKMLNEELKQVYEEKILLESFMELSTEEKLKKLSNPEKLNWIFSSKYADNYLILITESIFLDGNSMVLADYLTYGLSKIILEKQYNVSQLYFEVNEFKGKTGAVINIYEHSIKNKEYLCTVSCLNDKTEFIEMKLKSKNKNSLIFEDELGNAFLYDKNQDHSFIDTNDKDTIYVCEEIENVKSNIEFFYLKFMRNLNRYNKRKEEGYPAIMIQDSQKEYSESAKKIQEILKEDISIEDLEKMKNYYEELEEKDNEYFK